MTLKSIVANKLEKLTSSLENSGYKCERFFASKSFLFVSCAVIFLVSIFLRSMFDIGSDTGFYLDLGRKIARGGHYYYDFFESNFPLSFYYYALQHKLAVVSGISPVILSEFFINFFALLSIFWSAKILQKAKIFDDKIAYNFLIIAFFLGFFWRIDAIKVMEFGTKTSLLLILLFPYFCYSFSRKIAFTKKDLIARGALMGLIPCLKPHYLIFILFFEAKNLYLRLRHKKNRLKILTHFLLEEDKLLMAFIGALYIFLMIKFTPEFFEFMIPMWSKLYMGYRDFEGFKDGFLQLLGYRMIWAIFPLLIFARKKITEDDVVIFLFFIAALILLLSENLGTMDQMTVFYAVATICFFKIIPDLLHSDLAPFGKNKFIIIILMLLPIFELELLPYTIFSVGGFVNLWWMLVPIYPFILWHDKNKKHHREIKKFFSPLRIVIFAVLYLAMLATAFASLKYINEFAHIVVNLGCLFVVLWFFEKRLNSFLSKSLSTLSIFVIITSFSMLTYSYVTSLLDVAKNKCCATQPNDLSRAAAYYIKTFAPQQNQAIITSSNLINHQFPLLNYFNKENPQKMALNFLVDSRKKPGILMFENNDAGWLFDNLYFLDDLNRQLRDPNTKVLLFKVRNDEIMKKFCRVSNLEFFLRDREFRKLFFQNFRFENRILVIQKSDEIVDSDKIVKSWDKKNQGDIFAFLDPSEEKITHDYEVYVRRDVGVVKKPKSCGEAEIKAPILEIAQQNKICNSSNHH
jgi:hypothetical protein